MANRKVEVRTLDNDPVTKLQSVQSWEHGTPNISVHEPRIKIANKQTLLVDDSPISSANKQEFYYITDGPNKGKFVKKEDVFFL